MKNIQYAESNDANEGAMKQKFQNVLKQKNAYDKIKTEVEAKQKKLKKVTKSHITAHLNEGQHQIMQFRTVRVERCPIKQNNHSAVLRIASEHVRL